MPTIFTHGFVAILASKACAREETPPRFWALSLGCSILPDLDTFGFAVGVRYEDFFGHRGFFHSLPFALIVGLLVSSLAFSENKLWSRKGLTLSLYFALLTASHGVLDALTDGGLGIAFLSPFTNERYFLPWRPLAVSPLGLRAFLSARGLEVMLNEFMWIWIPGTALCLAVIGIRKAAAGKKGGGGNNGE